MNNAVFGKNMKNLRKHLDIKLFGVRTKKFGVIIYQNFCLKIYQPQKGKKKQPNKNKDTHE